MIDLRLAVPATVSGGLYHPTLRALADYAASGVYAIIDEASGDVLYVGESHTGRLYDTITRHFRKWRIDPRNDPKGRRRGGTTYNRARVLVAFVLCEDQDARVIQAAEIARLDPRDNRIDATPQEVPF